jgi:hypothetical protein
MPNVKVPGSYGGMDSVGKSSQEKLLRQVYSARTKTDTGGWGEYPKALEWIMVKELGKIDL